jgi:zinc/manganese transport system permease protein
MSDHGPLPPLLTGILAAIIGALSLYRLRNLAVRVQESIIGILFILAATGSLLLLSADPHGGEQLKAILVGQILWFQPEALIPLFICYSIVLFLWSTLKQKLGDWLFYPLFAITITLSTQVVGVYLVFASLIIPSLSTLNHTQPVIKAFILGALSYLMGLVLSALLDLPAGAAIVWCLAFNGLMYWAIMARFKES